MAINSVPAARGWSWVADAWELFKREPGTWIGVTLALAVIFLVLGVIPVIGAVAAVVLTPVFAAGPLLGCRALEEGRGFDFSYLFAGFRERFGTLAAVGAIYLVATLVIVFVAGLITGFSLF